MKTYTGLDGKTYECGTWEYFGKHYQEYQARIHIDAELGVGVDIKIDGSNDEYNYHVTLSKLKDYYGESFLVRNLTLISINDVMEFDLKSIPKMHKGMVEKALNYYEIYMTK